MDKNSNKIVNAIVWLHRKIHSEKGRALIARYYPSIESYFNGSKIANYLDVAEWFYGVSKNLGVAEDALAEDIAEMEAAGSQELPAMSTRLPKRDFDDYAEIIRSRMHKIQHQGRIGTCAAHTHENMLQGVQRNQVAVGDGNINRESFHIDINFLYRNYRFAGQRPGQDTGTYVGRQIQAIINEGLLVRVTEPILNRKYLKELDESKVFDGSNEMMRIFPYESVEMITNNLDAFERKMASIDVSQYAVQLSTDVFRPGYWGVDLITRIFGKLSGRHSVGIVAEKIDGESVCVLYSKDKRLTDPRVCYMMDSGDGKLKPVSFDFLKKANVFLRVVKLRANATDVVAPSEKRNVVAPKKQVIVNPNVVARIEPFAATRNNQGGPAVVEVQRFLNWWRDEYADSIIRETGSNMLPLEVNGKYNAYVTVGVDKFSKWSKARNLGTFGSVSESQLMQWNGKYWGQRCIAVAKMLLNK